MGEWIVTLSILLYIVSTVVSVLEEWPKQGLTDTSVLVLVLWISASLGMMGGGLMIAWFPLTVIGMLSAIVTGYALGLKLHDYLYIVKGLKHQHQNRHRGQHL